MKRMKTQDFDLLSGGISLSLNRLMENKKIRLVTDSFSDPMQAPKVKLSKKITHVLFLSDCTETPLGFESLKVFNEVRGFNTIYSGALVFDNLGRISLYKNIGGILYAIYCEKDDEVP